MLERWRPQPGQPAVQGESVAEVRIEDALYEVLAPASGRLTILMLAPEVIEPGEVIGRIEPA